MALTSHERSLRDAVSARQSRTTRNVEPGPADLRDAASGPSSRLQQRYWHIVPPVGVNAKRTIDLVWFTAGSPPLPLVA